MATGAGARRACAASLYTDIGRDGTLGGPNLDARCSGWPRRRPPLRLIASGGDLLARRPARACGTSDSPNLDGMIVGRALYEGRFTVSEALEVLAARQRA